jgi:N-acetylglucosamine kinase
MPYVMGLEGGGTKTACLIADENARIVGHGLGGPTNRNFVRPAVARKSILDAVRLAVKSCSARPKRIDVCCMAYADAEAQALVRRVIPVDRIIPSNEDEVARTANLSSTFGVVVVAGTGSMARAINKKGQGASTGGWGTPLGDEGGAVDVAMKAIAAAIRASDGRGPATRLQEEVVEYFGLANIRELVPLFYQKGVLRHRIGGFFANVLDAAREGDGVAKGILRYAGRELGLCAAAAIRRAGMESEAFDVVVCGGVAQAGALVLRPLANEVRKIAPRARVWSERLSPVCGALLIALRELGLPLNDALRKKLQASIREAGLVGWPSKAVLEGGTDVGRAMA